MAVQGKDQCFPDDLYQQFYFCLKQESQAVVRRFSKEGEGFEEKVLFRACLMRKCQDFVVFA